MFLMHLSNKSTSYVLRQDEYDSTNDQMCWRLHVDLSNFTHVSVVSMDFFPFTLALTCISLNLIEPSPTDPFGTAAVVHDKNGYHPFLLSMLT